MEYATFPISRDDLQNLAKVQEMIRFKTICTQIADAFTEQILEYAYKLSKCEMGEKKHEKKIVIRLNNVRMRDGRVLITKERIPIALDILKERFPDTHFETDPLVTYVIADWS